MIVQGAASQSANLQEWQNSAGTGLAVVDENGNVGIGTATPQSLLDVQGPVGTGATGAGILTLATKELTIVDGDELGRINFNAPLESDGSDSILAGAAIWAEADDTFSTTVNSTELVFGTATTSAAVERMRIDSSGNVGIGTTTPAALLHIRGAGTGTTDIIRVAGTTSYGSMAFYEDTTLRGYFGYGDDGNIFTGAATDSFSIRSEGALHLGGSGNNLTMTLSSGNVGIGTAAPTGHLQIDGNISASAWTTDGISFDSNAATYTDTSTAAAGTVATRTANSFGAPTFASTNAITVTDAFTLYAPKPVAGTNTTITRTNSAYFEGAVMLGAVAANNGFSTGSLGDGSTTMYIGNSTINVTAPSDIITKENISSTKFGISQLMQFSVKDFLYKEEYVKEKGGQKQHTGMIAQEVEEIYPDAMIYRSDNLKAIDYNKLIPLIIKSIQDLKLGGLTSNGAVGSGQVSGVQSSYIGSQIKEGLLALGASINKGIATVEEIVAQKLNVKTARTQNLEMVDSETGEIYCAWIAGGEWQKAKGECGSVVATTDKSEILNPIEPKGSPRSVQSETNSNVQNSNAENETTESGDVGLPAGSPTSGASSGEIGSLPASSEQAQEVVQQAAQAAQAAQQAASNALETVENAQQAIQEQVQEVVQHAAETADQTAKKAVKEMKEEIKEEVKQELKEEKAAEQSGETRSPENLNADSVEVGSPPASAGEQSVAEPVAEPVFEPPANSVSEIIQDAAAGLINAVQDFIKSIFKTGFEKVSSLPIIKNATAGISAPMNNLWQIIIKLF